MLLARTTIRIEKRLKKEVEKIAFEENKSIQEVINQALKDYLKEKAKKKAKKIVFETVDLGVPLDNLTRSDYYDDPKF